MAQTLPPTPEQVPLRESGGVALQDMRVSTLG